MVSMVIQIFFHVPTISLSISLTQIGPDGNPGHVLPLPDKFFHFDLNGDELVKLNELAQYLGLDSAAVEAPFIITDTDGKLGGGNDI